MCASGNTTAASQVLIVIDDMLKLPHPPPFSSRVATLGVSILEDLRDGRSPLHAPTTGLVQCIVVEYSIV